MPKLIFSGNLPNTIRNNILKLPVIPAGASYIIQDGVQDGLQYANTAIIYRRVDIPARLPPPQKKMTQGFLNSLVEGISKFKIMAKKKHDFSTNKGRYKCDTSFSCNFDWKIHLLYYFCD